MNFLIKILIIMSLTNTVSAAGWAYESRWDYLGNPWAARDIAHCWPTQNNNLVNRIWALNFDRTLWYNDHQGNQQQWKYAGIIQDARQIACRKAELWALNDNNSVWRYTEWSGWIHLFTDHNIKSIGGGGGAGPSGQLIGVTRDNNVYPYRVVPHGFTGDRINFHTPQVIIKGANIHRTFFHLGPDGNLYRTSWDTWRTLPVINDPRYRHLKIIDLEPSAYGELTILTNSFELFTLHETRSVFLN